MVYDNRAYIGFYRAYDHVRASFFIKGLAERFRVYLKYCHVCNTHQTVRYKSYGSLKFIFSLFTPYHTVSGNFIVGLPVIANGFDMALTFTCKFSKRVKIIPGKSTWKAVNWAHAVFDAIIDWGIFLVFIIDRDPKWLSEFWRTIFENMGTKIAVTTAYYL
jgi:hypothetical protein